MRSKNILSVAAFITAFALSAAFANLFITEVQTEAVNVPVYGSQSTSYFTYRSNSATANKITALINQDKRNGRESERAYYEYDGNIFSDNSSVSGYADAVEEYVDASSSMKHNDLPDNFQIEWREHMQAWREYSEFLNRMGKVSNREALSDTELREVDNFHSREISRTWKEVLQTGTSYGADVY